MFGERAPQLAGAAPPADRDAMISRKKAELYYHPKAALSTAELWLQREEAYGRPTRRSLERQEEEAKRAAEAAAAAEAARQEEARAAEVHAARMVWEQALREEEEAATRAAALEATRVAEAARQAEDAAEEALRAQATHTIHAGGFCLLPRLVPKVGRALPAVALLGPPPGMSRRQLPPTETSMRLERSRSTLVHLSPAPRARPMINGHNRSLPKMSTMTKARSLPRL